MTNNTQNNGGADAFTSAYNVISVSFDPDSNAYAALTALKELDAQSQLGVEAAAVVVRGDDGGSRSRTASARTSSPERRAEGFSAC